MSGETNQNMVAGNSPREALYGSEPLAPVIGRMLSPDVLLAADISIARRNIDNCFSRCKRMESFGSDLDGFFKQCASLVSENREVCDELTSMTLERLRELYELGQNRLTYEFLSKCISDEPVWLEIEIIISAAESNELSALIHIRNIDERHSEREHLVRLSQRDSLTGLFNYDATHQLIREYLKCGNTGGMHALLMVDVDNFKAINDTFGHQAGDLILVEISKRLLSQMRHDDVVGRVGGDEFMVFIKKLNSKEEIRKKISRILDTLHEPFLPEDEKGYYMQCSIGCAVCNNAEKSLSQLYSEADTALYCVKNGGKGYFEFYNDKMKSSGDTRGNCTREISRKPFEGISGLETGNSILIVSRDDEKRKALSKSLLTDGYRVLCAQNAAETINLLDIGSLPDAVILDLGGSKSDCISLLRSIRIDMGYEDLPLIAVGEDSDCFREECCIAGASDCISSAYTPALVISRLRFIFRQRSRVNMELKRLKMQLRVEQYEKSSYKDECDPLTGVLTERAFIVRASKMILEKKPGSFVISCFDIDNFKVLNDQYGRAVGDRVLKNIADAVTDCFDRTDGFCARINADNFTAMYPIGLIESGTLGRVREKAARLMDPPVDAVLSIGRYVVTDLTLSVEDMQDRALLAKETVKGRYDIHTSYFDESMRNSLIHKQHIVEQMGYALANKQFEVWLQPQYNHVNGTRIGAEALSRWNHPEMGQISPSVFIPIFEQNGFIYELDKFVWDEACRYLRERIDAGESAIPVSVNVSRYDVFRSDFVSTIAAITQKHGIPAGLLRLEITESAFSKSPEQIISVIEQLKKLGFYIEIDDFGSGYSSLNILKDVPADIIKLDMRFLDDKNDSHRGGRILESVIRMARWLDMPVIAEGVETKQQADYLLSLGCEYIQGYLYAKPMTMSEFNELPDRRSAASLENLETVPYLGQDSFWNPDTIETMVFNRFSGGACVFEYRDGNYEMLRINEKFAGVFNSKLSVREILRLVPFSKLSDSDREHMDMKMSRAVASGDSEIFHITSTLYCEPGKSEYVRIAVRVISRCKDRYLFYAYVENRTRQKTAEKDAQRMMNRLNAIMNSMNGGVSAVTKVGSKYFPMFSNDRFYRLLGYTKEEFSAEFDGIYGYIVPEDREFVAGQIETCLNERSQNESEYRCVKRNGDIIWVRTNSAFFEIDGRDSVVSVTNDITAEKAYAQALESMMSDMPTGFMNLHIVDESHIVPEHFSNGLCKLIGLTREEFSSLYGKSITAGIHPDDLVTLKDSVFQGMHECSGVSFNVRIIGAKGRYVILRASFRFVLDGSGEIYANVFCSESPAHDERVFGEP